ncbi:MAG TPA: hypothetical protein VHC43_01130 [Mycobacteriales bacterium]|nr:hypothetical protein [Mycobacteriales bacterium]
MSPRHGDDAPGRRLLPDFDVVWSARHRASCGSCQVMTPRNAAHLWVAATQLADTLDAERDFIYTPVRGEWCRLPWVVAICVTEEWYGRFVDTVLDLADDVAAGRCPVPRCTGEEMALHLIFEDIAEPRDSDLSDLVAIACDGLPISEWDRNWEVLAAYLFPNPRVRALLADNFGGIDDDLELVAETGIVRLAPERWFHVFGDVSARPAPACGCPVPS